MDFIERDFTLQTEANGIAFYSPKTARSIGFGNFLMDEYTEPDKVASHIKKGDVVGFFTGSSGEYTLKFREGQPPETIKEEYPVSVELGIEIQDKSLCMVGFDSLADWKNLCPDGQRLNIEPGFYQITLNTRCPESEIWGDEQIIYVHLNRVSTMPEVKSEGVPQLLN